MHKSTSAGFRAPVSELGRSFLESFATLVFPSSLPAIATAPPPPDSNEDLLEQLRQTVCP